MDSAASSTGVAIGVSIGLGCIVVWLVVSIRLMLIARRTRMAPEIAMASYFGLLALAFVLGIPAALLQQAGDLEGARFISASSLVCFAFAAFALALGTWRTFRASSPIVGWLCAAALCSMMICWWLTVQSDGPISIASTTTSNIIFGLTRCAIYAWAFGESYAYYQKLRRQALLGMGDPVVAQQILLWGTAALGMGASAFLMIIRNLMGLSQGTTLTLGALMPIFLSLAGTAAIWCAFFPPSFLRDYASARAAKA